MATAKVGTVSATTVHLLLMILYTACVLCTAGACVAAGTSRVPQAGRHTKEAGRNKKEAGSGGAPAGSWPPGAANDGSTGLSKAL